MINYTEQYSRIEKTFKELKNEYEIFRKKPTYNNRTQLINKVQEHRRTIYDFTSSIKNIVLK